MREERRARNGGASGGGCGVARRARGASGRRSGRAGRRGVGAGARGVGAGAVPCCLHRTKSKAADGSLVRYLCLIVYTLSSSVFSGLGDFWGEKSSSGVWGEAPYIMVLGRGMGRSPIKTFSLMSGSAAVKETREFNVDGGEFSLLRTLFDNSLTVTAVKDGKKGSVGLNSFEDEAISRAIDDCLAAAVLSLPRRRRLGTLSQQVSFYRG